MGHVAMHWPVSREAHDVTNWSSSSHEGLHCSACVGFEHAHTCWQPRPGMDTRVCGMLQLCSSHIHICIHNHMRVCIQHLSTQHVNTAYTTVLPVQLEVS